VIYRIVDSIDKDEAKQIVKAIKAMKVKVTPSIQGDEVRVSGKKIDDLQAVMTEVKKLDLKAPLVFGNFKRLLTHLLLALAAKVLFYIDLIMWCVSKRTLQDITSSAHHHSIRLKLVLVEVLS